MIRLEVFQLLSVTAAQVNVYVELATQVGAVINARWELSFWPSMPIRVLPILDCHIKITKPVSRELNQQPNLKQIAGQ